MEQRALRGIVVRLLAFSARRRLQAAKAQVYDRMLLRATIVLIVSRARSFHTRIRLVIRRLRSRAELDLDDSLR